ncbi:MAG: oligoendopeptidase F, partial [bacterium]|nr:oligoendopeptidase F [bacterium]
MNESTPTPGTGPAAGVRWDLSHLYPEPAREALEADLAQALEAACSFEERYRGKIATLSATELARAVTAYEELQEPVTRAAAFAQLQFAGDTQAPAHGALLQLVQERATLIRQHLLFFELEWVA